MAQFYLAIWLLVLPGGLFAGWRLSRRMRKMTLAWRMRILRSLLILDGLWTIQIFTGWSLAVPIDSVVTTCIFLFFYLVTSFALWSCFARVPDGAQSHSNADRSNADHEGTRILSRIVSVLLLFPLLPVLLLLSSVGNLAVILAVGDPNYQFLGQGRVSPTVTYRMATKAALIGGSEFPAYVLYRNPRWMPLIHKKAANGAVQCTPELAHFVPGKDSRTVNLTCAGQVIEQIALE